MEHVYRLLLPVLLTHCVTSYPEYRKRIPNGFSVPRPCQPGRIWLGVGHFDSYGTGSWNNFGVDFGHANNVHWNNPALLTGLTDSSGLALYYTPHLRPHDAGVLLIGTPLFVLPPNQAEVLVDSTCSSQCTQRGMLGPVNVTSAWNHMYYSGKRMNIHVARDQQHVTNLTHEKVYNYYTPTVHRFASDFLLYPGDELRTRCVFNTLVFNMTIITGFSARNEMCLGMITYFPKQNMTMSTCLDYLGISMCTKETWGECKDLPKFVEHIKTTDVYRDVLLNCWSFVPCVAECVQAIVKHMGSEPCLQGRVWEYIQNTLTSVPDGREFLSRLASCMSPLGLELIPDTRFGLSRRDPYRRLTLNILVCPSIKDNMFGVFVCLIVV